LRAKQAAARGLGGGYAGRIGGDYAGAAAGQVSGTIQRYQQMVKGGVKR
jgi:hypothetical protein